MKRISRCARLVGLLSALTMAWFLIPAAFTFADDQPLDMADEQALDSADQQADESDASVPDEEINPSIALKGSVWRTKPGIAFLKTPVGLLTLSSKTTLKDFRASQEVSFHVHGPHLVVEIRKRADGSLIHRYLGGPLTRSPENDNMLLWWTPEGEKLFHPGTFEQTLSKKGDGEVATVEVDETDTVIGVHDIQFDLQIGQIPAGGSNAHLLLTGTIAKLKSSFIFFRTPVGVVNVNAKVGIKNAKVGQTMTLRMREDHLTADLSGPSVSSTTRRFVTGPLEFAGPDRASVKLWTPNGEQTYPTDRAKSALAGAKEGSRITVELNGQGDVVGFHRSK